MNSELIRAYVQASQKIEMRLEAERLAKIDGITRRRKKPEKKISKKKKKESDSKQNSIINLDQHRLTWDQFYKKVGVSSSVIENGLSTTEAESRNEKYGENCLTERVTDPWYKKLIHEWTSPFALMLWAGGGLCFLSYGLDPSDPSNLYLGIVLSFVVMLTGVVTFFQNAKSDSIMASFKNFIPPMCKVLRDGNEDALPARKLAIGDVVILKEGDNIPADVRIFQCKDLRVDNSSLTGEPDPLLRSTICDNPKKILETKNVAFFGTLCKKGHGKGIVFNIGDNTIIGQIAGMADTAEAGLTPLRRELNRFIKMITIIALVLGVLFFLAGFLVKYTFIQNLVFAIGIIVANVPEGLLATITISLSVAAVKLSKKKVLVKNLESVETLGSTNCICSDKTGTLTQNRMTIEHIFYDLKIYKGHNYEKYKNKKHTFEYDKDCIGFEELRKCAVNNCTATFSNAMPKREQDQLANLQKSDRNYAKYKLEIENGWIEKLKNMPYYERPVNGDASETAIVKFYQPFEDILKVREKNPMGLQLDGKTPSQVPFNSAHKFALKVLEERTQNSNWVVYLKGAPERVWNKCSHVLRDGKEIPFTDELKKITDDAQIAFAKGGERVLGFAKYHLPKDQYPVDHRFKFNGAYDLDIPMDRFVFLGLMSLMDPPRDAVPDAIHKCKTAGIKVIMVTGDHQLTASSIAKQIGIFEKGVETSLELKERLGCSMEEALEKADAIVINGDMLTEAVTEDEGLPEKQKGKKLEKWLKKEQIVFARTSPAQKLYIVQGCQSRGYTVAVTGDGVNDSPAIKQADIGIAMGMTGTDVTKDSADMILLNDDFSAIILGIEEGRKIFDNLKKSIAYTLTSNIPEIIPFIIFILVQIPLPLSTVLILCVDLGTDIFPAVSFAYEEAELDIMTRRPRPRHEHLVSKRLLTFAYGQMGIIQTCGGFICYFLVMNDFGLPYYSLPGLVLKKYYPHAPSDIYNPDAPFFGNSNLSCKNNKLVLPDHVEGIVNENGRILDWLFLIHKSQDIRMGFLKNMCKPGGLDVKQSVYFSRCIVHQISPITKRPVCYSTEALKYAQTSFFFSIVITQFSNSLSCKTRKLSLAFQGFRNYFMIFGWASEYVLTIILAYFLPINYIFGTRDLIFEHYIMPAVPFSILMLIYDEIRKFLIRNLPKTKDGRPNWFERNCLY